MTDKQKQCLLAYLGYYAGELDGIFGKLSRSAEARFREDFRLTGEDTAGALLEAVSGQRQTCDRWEGIEHFTREEFRCKCGGKHCSGFPAEPDRRLLQAAQEVRSHFGAPATVTSGLRCPIHNAAVGGAAKSRHITGKAMDFRVRGVDSQALLGFLETLPGIRYAYPIDKTHVHMDVE